MKPKTAWTPDTDELKKKVSQIVDALWECETKEAIEDVLTQIYYPGMLEEISALAGVENPEEAVKELVEAAENMFPMFEPVPSMLGRHRVEKLRAALKPFEEKP